jgi:isoleucyl-tRNA synthetase
MRQLRAVVRLARFVREQAGVKHRQPLRVARVGGLSPAMLDAHRELLAGELNVKAVEPLAMAVRRELVLDYPRLGKRLRGKVKEVAAAARAGDYEPLADGSVRVAGELLAPDELSWRTFARPGQVVAARDGFVVMLDTTVDEGLAREGLARELNRVAQDLRKRARLPYGARVQLAIIAASGAPGAATASPRVDALERCLEDHAAWLCDQAGSVPLVRHPLGSPHAATLDLEGAAIAVELVPLAESEQTARIRSPRM